ncbi:glycosyl transferase family 90 [Cognatiyoonia sp. IB215182]|uniref:glycosyl transferase family 90 n=1 Tax=Cognatiyoonia sp. IB215182 TaxID=3097353 RepID=UPI002A0E4730|nr:glycosyl transferase family 90 [Cognatiyoonia sp. IB215182]MDX8353049.1 glycosyl transferase family 90 [Cognatiyoonia sp. IB215182]
MLNPIADAKKRLNAHRRKLRRRKRILNETYLQFSKAGVTPPKVTIEPSAEPPAPTDVVLVRKRADHIVALVNESHRWGYLVEVINKIACYSYWFNQTSSDIKQIVVNASDGNLPTGADYKFSVSSDRHTPLPDVYFFRDRGYAETDAFAAEQALDWDDRSDEIIWRGRPNGTGVFSLEPELIDNPAVNQRLRMAMKSRELDIDFRFVACPDHDYGRLIEDAGYVADFIPTHDWSGMKYAVDIDGFTNAWNNFMQRLKLGCCVLKVGSPMGYYQWYYHKLIPWEHYVPIRTDLGDLATQIDWVKTNPDKAREIAANGQAVARALTFESETRVAAEAIEAREARR